VDYKRIPVRFYIRDEDLYPTPKQMRQDYSFINLTPQAIEAGLKYVLNMARKELLNIIVLSKKYGEIRHNPVAIAPWIKDDIDNVMMESNF